MKKVLSKIGITSASTLAVMLMGAPLASASPVTLWNYEIHSSFSAFSPGGVASGTPNPSLANEPTHLSWGVSTGSGQSELSVTDSTHSVSLVATNGAAVAGPTMTLLNRQITDPNHQALTQATLHLQTFLNPVAPPDPQTLQQDFWLIFRETALKDALVLWDPADLNQALIFGGATYDLHLTLNGLSTLSNNQCAEAGASAGCQGLLGPMNDSGTMRTGFSITGPSGQTAAPQLEAVPEPSTIVLLASGFVGLLVYGRKKGVLLRPA